MGDAAMVLEFGYRPAKAPEHVEIWRFRGQHHGESGVSRDTVRTRATEARACQKMCDRFQTIGSNYWVVCKF